MHCQFTSGIGLDNKKDAMMSHCPDRKKVMIHNLVNAQLDWPAGGNTGQVFLLFGGAVCADQISNCPLDRVLTNKNLIYSLNLQYSKLQVIYSTLFKLQLIYLTVIT